MRYRSNIVFKRRQRDLTEWTILAVFFLCHVMSVGLMAIGTTLAITGQPYPGIACIYTGMVASLATAFLQKHAGDI